MLSGVRVGAFMPNYHMPRITPIQYPNMRGIIHQLPYQKNLRNIIHEENTGIPSLENVLKNNVSKGIQGEEDRILGFSPEPHVSTLPVRKIYDSINSAPQLKRRLGITSLDSVYQGLKQIYEPASTEITKAWLEQIRSFHLVRGKLSGNASHQLSHGVTITREYLPFSSLDLIRSSRHSLDSRGTVFNKVTGVDTRSRADAYASASLATGLDASISSIAEVAGAVAGAETGAISFPELDSYPIISDAIRGVTRARAEAYAYSVPAATSRATSIKVGRRPPSSSILFTELESKKEEMGNSIYDAYDNLLHTFSIWTHVSQLLSYLPVVDNFFRMAYRVTDDYLGSGLYKANIISKSLPIVADAFSQYHKATGFPAYAEAMERLPKYREVNFPSGYQRIYEETAGLRKGDLSDESNSLMKFERERAITFDGIKNVIAEGREKILLDSDDNSEEPYDPESIDALDVLSNKQKISGITQIDKNWIADQKTQSQKVDGVKERIWEDLVKDQPLDGLSSRAKDAQEKIMQGLVPLDQIKQIHKKYSEPLSDLARLMDSQSSLFKVEIPSAFVHKNQLLGHSGKIESVVASIRKSTDSSSEQVVTNLKNYVRKKEKDITRWKRAVGVGLSKEFLSVYLQPMSALAARSNKGEGILNTSSFDLMPTSETLRYFNFSGVHNFPNKPHQDVISFPSAQPLGLPQHEQQKEDKLDITFANSGTMEWQDEMDNASRPFELLPDDFKDIQRGDVGNSTRISSNNSRPRTLNRSILQRYIKDSIRGEISKYYHSDLPYSSQPRNEENERELYLKVQLELEKMLKDELRRYGYIN